MTPSSPSDPPVDPWARGGAMSDPDRVGPGIAPRAQAAAATTPATDPAPREPADRPTSLGPTPHRPDRRLLAIGVVLAVGIVAVVVAVRAGDDGGTSTEPAATSTPTIASVGSTVATTAAAAPSTAGGDAPSAEAPAFAGPVALAAPLAAATPFELDLLTNANGIGAHLTRISVPNGEVLASSRVTSTWTSPVLVAARDGLVLQDADRPGLTLARDDGGITEVGPDVLDDVWQVTGLPDADGFWAVSLPSSSLGATVVTARHVDLTGIASEAVRLDVIGRDVLPAAAGALLFADAGGTFRVDADTTVTRFSSGTAVASGAGHVLQRICTRSHACRFEVLPIGGGTVERTFELDIDLIDAWLAPDGASLVGIEDSGSSSGAAAQVRPPRLVHVDLATGQRTALVELQTLRIPPAGMQAGLVAWASSTLLVYLDGAGGVAAYDRTTGTVLPVLAEPRDDIVAVTARPLVTPG